MNVTVVGAGVVGLSCAVELERAGHRVRVLATRPPAHTTSAVAAAVWFPYQVGPVDRVGRWAARTRDRLLALCGSAEAGVDRLVGYECRGDDAPPWWAVGVGAVEAAPAPVRGAPPAWRFDAPRADSRRFLPWLVSQLRADIELTQVTALADVPGDRVIHCTGLGAATLVGDASLTALRGQIVVVEPGTIPLDLTFTDDRGAEPIFYAIPRGDEVVLGGTAEPTTPDDPCVPDDAVTARILGRCARLGWRPGPVRVVRVGLRPRRASVRLEVDATDPRIIHNYGHGGAGFTLALGCAEDVAGLVGA
ncbi:MAG: FAD-binding oxidoreductase [Kofleriaceae bacterium]|jgi:D-amino-acid oxidase|nr:FAD-binding oxidoreductase [Kofleriaceae bacterium]MBP6838556.1 FAD-binding oxidoreductase [Kofleriaceae bacterium]MBP9207975.1 FAD-binding oxidoreductase [Kofleriaceae bacterium]